MLTVNGKDVSVLPFRQLLSAILINRRPLTTTWKLAPSRSLTPEGKLRQDNEHSQDAENAENAENAEDVSVPTHPKQQQQQRTTVTIDLPLGDAPLGLVLVGRKPKSATQQRLMANGMGGCGTMVKSIQHNSLMWNLTKTATGKLIRKGMQLITVNGTNVETHTLAEVQDLIADCRSTTSTKCTATFRTAPSRSLTPEGRIKSKTNTVDYKMQQQMKRKTNMSTTVMFTAGPLGLELVGRKPRPESIAARVARRRQEAQEQKQQERTQVEQEIHLLARDVTMHAFFEGLDRSVHESNTSIYSPHSSAPTGYITKRDFLREIALERGGGSKEIYSDLFALNYPKFYTLITTPSVLKQHISTLQSEMEDRSQGHITWEVFNKWTLLSCGEEWLSASQKKTQQGRKCCLHIFYGLLWWTLFFVLF